MIANPLFRCAVIISVTKALQQSDLRTYFQDCIQETFIVGLLGVNACGSDRTI